MWPQEKLHGGGSGRSWGEEEVPAIGRVRGRSRERFGFARAWWRWWKAQFGWRWIECGVFAREGRRCTFGLGNRATTSTLVLKERGKRVRGVHVAWWRRQADSCVLAHAHAVALTATDGGRGAHDPHRDTVAIHIHHDLVFCKIHPKFELKSNFHQNKSCSEF